jgi:hypothetical protein
MLKFSLAKNILNARNAKKEIRKQFEVKKIKKTKKVFAM